MVKKHSTNIDQEPVVSVSVPEGKRCQLSNWAGFKEETFNSFLGTMSGDIPWACTQWGPATEAGCSQEEGPKKGFVMGSRTQVSRKH